MQIWLEATPTTTLPAVVAPLAKLTLEVAGGVVGFDGHGPGRAVRKPADAGKTAVRLTVSPAAPGAPAPPVGASTPPPATRCCGTSSACAMPGGVSARREGAPGREPAPAGPYHPRRS